MSARILPFKRPEPRQSLVCWEYEATLRAFASARDEAFKLLRYDWERRTWRPGETNEQERSRARECIETALELLDWLIADVIPLPWVKPPAPADLHSCPRGCGKRWRRLGPWQAKHEAKCAGVQRHG